MPPLGPGSMNKKRPSRAIFVVYVIGILFGPIVIHWQNGEFEREKASLQWPTVSGKIMQSEEVYVPGRNSGDYRADIAYTYEVNGTRHVSHQISLWSANLGGYGGVTGAFVRNHPSGSTVDVRYDPANPKNAVLVPGADLGTYRLFVGMGGLSGLVSIFGLIHGLRRRSRLVALLNSTAADSRVVTLNRADVLKGTAWFVRSALLAGLSFALAIAIILPPLVTKPLGLPGTPEMRPWRWFAGTGCCLAAAFSIWLAVRRGRRAECPLCGNLLNRTVFTTSHCADCGTRIVFVGQAPPRSSRMGRS